VGFACYLVSEETGAYEWHSMELITLRGERIAEITAFLDPEGYTVFGLPATVPGPDRGDPT
jgi:RNA polymerase sigma-70 factor (ECF subfamily)